MKDNHKAPDKAQGGVSPGHDPAVIERHDQDSLRDDGRNPGRPIPSVPAAEHVNHTPFWSQYYQSINSAGEVFHTVVTRVSYDMTSVARGEQIGLLGYCAEQSELEMGDVFADPQNPNTSELLWESDFCPYKPKCDVLVVNAATRPPMSDWQRTVGRANNPHLVPTGTRWSCGVGLGFEDQAGKHQQWHKSLGITGPRSTGLLGGVGDPKETHEVHLSWANAFGGPDDERNPLGTGHSSSKNTHQPQQELLDKPYKGGLLQGNYPPVHLGPVGKVWLPRRTLAGTYDDEWLKNQWPWPPKDLDDGFWNCAPVDQQIEYPAPGAQIVLINLWPPTPPGQQPPPPQPGHEVWRGQLPQHQLFVLPIYKAANIGIVTKAPTLPCLLDTLRIDLQAQRIEAVYRTRIPQSTFGRHSLVRLETRMSPKGKPLESVAPEQMGPLGR